MPTDHQSSTLTVSSPCLTIHNMIGNFLLRKRSFNSIQFQRQQRERDSVSDMDIFLVSCSVPIEGELGAHPSRTRWTRNMAFSDLSPITLAERAKQ